MISFVRDVGRKLAALIARCLAAFALNAGALSWENHAEPAVLLAWLLAGGCWSSDLGMF